MNSNGKQILHFVIKAICFSKTIAN